MVTVNINIDRDKYKLRWSYQGKRYSLSIGSVSKPSLKAAKAKAALIESDILFERFDTTLGKYSVRHRQADKVLEIWHQYKSANSKTAALTTQKACWSQVDRCLAKLPTRLLAINKADEAVAYLLKQYSAGTLKRVLADINAAVNYAQSRPYYKLTKLPKTTRKPIECFSDTEVNAIISAFENNTYQSPYSEHCHDYYANYVSFLAYTSCRPEEAIALTWDDVDLVSKVLRFDKAYSKGILKDTKNHKVRDFPINCQLKRVLVKHTHNLVFPSVSGSYINHNNWSRRYWKPIVSGLVSEGKLKKYLKPYCLRHSGITRLIRAGYDIATVAVLAGTSPEMIFRNYLAPIDTTEFELPEV